MEKRYIYNGDFSPIDIGKDTYTLIRGNVYSLPPEDKKVKSLVRLGKLTLIQEQNPKKGAKS